MASRRATLQPAVAVEVPVAGPACDAATGESMDDVAACEASSHVTAEAAHVTGESAHLAAEAASNMTTAETTAVTASASASHGISQSGAERRGRREHDHYFAHHVFPPLDAVLRPTRQSMSFVIGRWDSGQSMTLANK
jgi:hypothetical protein